MQNQPSSWTLDLWQYHASQLLKEIGPGLITPSAYDTAWTARLIEQDELLGKAALEWLCSHQLSDGSWGAQEPACYHDRIICTLAAMTTLARYGRRAHDRKSIADGQAALEGLTRDATSRLLANPAGATVGFEMIAPTLVTEAESLGILSNQGNRIMGRLEQQRRLKMTKLAGRPIDRMITAAFSVEMVGEDISKLDIDNLQEENGSIAYSPSATAYYLYKVRPGDKAALSYLKQVNQDGAFPYVFPADVFECAWSLWNLALTELSGSLKAETRKSVEILRKAWVPGKGVGAVTGLSLHDGDCSAVTFEAVTRWDGDIDAEGLLYFEVEDHFLCFKLESDPSTSTNIHLLGALRSGGFEALASHPSVKKILGFLGSQRLPDGMWLDKWHLSPFYPTAHAVIACAGYNDELVSKAVQRIIASQNPDGSWGAILSTAEETAYALQALCAWKKSGHDVDVLNLRRGARWLTYHMEDPYPPLWIGKSLYAPVRVVRSSILSAMGMVLQEVGGEL